MLLRQHKSGIDPASFGIPGLIFQVLSRLYFFPDHFQTWHGYLQYSDVEHVRLYRFWFIKYVHNGPYNEPAYFGIPGLIKLNPSNGSNVSQILLKISSGFYHNHKTFCRIFTRLPTSHIENHRQRFQILILFRIIFKCDNDIYYLQSRTSSIMQVFKFGTNVDIYIYIYVFITTI